MNDVAFSAGETRYEFDKGVVVVTAARDVPAADIAGAVAKLADSAAKKEREKPS